MNTRDEISRLRQQVKELEKENKRLHDIEGRMKAADNDATKFAIEASDLRQRVKELEDSLAGKRKALAESRALYAQQRDCCKQRGERMKMMRYSNNSFMDWFDEKGEPL